MSEVANLNKIADLEGRVIVLRGLLKEIKEMLGYCPFCWANFKEPCGSGCKMGKELGDD